MKTFGKIKYKSGQWIFEKVEPHVMIKLKAVFEFIPKHIAGTFQLKHTKPFAVDLSWFLDRYPLQISSDDKEFLNDEKKDQLKSLQELEQLFDPKHVQKQVDLKKPLRPYQTVAVNWIHKTKRALVGDPVGLGKTAIGIGMLGSDQLPALVGCQTHLPSQWKEKIEEFSNLKVHVINTTKVYQLPPADVYIISYSKLQAWVNVLANGFLKTAIWDEIQEFRKTDSNKYRSGFKISQSMEYVLGLSATPIYNYGNEAFAIFNLIKPGCLGSLNDFSREWCGWGDEVKDPKALGTFLREQHLFLRRSREEVGRELPKLNKIVHTIDTDEKALKKIETEAKALALTVLQGASFMQKGQAARDLDIMVRHATGVSKAKSVAEYVKMLLSSGEKVLLAGWHRDVYDIWLEELKEFKPVLYTGSETPKQKDESKQKFINGETDLMMISLRSGIGLDGLQDVCSLCVIGELDWSPKVHEQLIGRLDRDTKNGTPNNVTAVFLVSNSGSDPAIIDILGLKSSQSDGIVDPLSTTQDVNIDESRIKLIAKQYLDKN